jgi:hypothetical protein
MDHCVFFIVVAIIARICIAFNPFLTIVCSNVIAQTNSVLSHVDIPPSSMIVTHFGHRDAQFLTSSMHPKCSMAALHRNIIHFGAKMLLKLILLDTMKCLGIIDLRFEVKWIVRSFLPNSIELSHEYVPTRVNKYIAIA